MKLKKFTCEEVIERNRLHCFTVMNFLNTFQMKMFIV